MADSGAAVTVVGPAIAGILREAGFTEHACSIPLQLAAGDEATTCSSFIIVKNATIETRYGEVRVPPHPVIVSNTLNIDGIVGLDMLTAAGVLVDPTLSSLWHIDHIHKRVRELEQESSVTSKQVFTVSSDNITLPELLKAPPLPEPPPDTILKLHEDV